MDASEDARYSTVQGQQARHFGKWRPITTAPQSGSHKRNPSETSSPSDARGGVRHPSAQVFSITGRRLTRRSLARAERGVREATAARVLTVWWRSIADECREARSRKIWATARVSAWVTKVVARRQREALRSRTERSARVVQARWRRATEIRRLAARAAACVVVQRVWRKWQRERRYTYRRVRRNVLLSLQSWARSILSRRQNTARKTIARAVTAAMTRHASKQHSAAAVILRGLEKACNRRRQSRLRLQRFARTPCLLRMRLAALSLARADRVQNGAATIVARAFRRALVRSAIVRAAFAARTLQYWYRTLLWRWGKRYTSTVTIQQAWRRRRTQRFPAEAEEQPPRKSAVKTAATETSTPTKKVPACAAHPGKLLAADGAATLDTCGHENNVDKLSPCRQATGVALAGCSCAPQSSPPDSSVEENTIHGLRVPVNGENLTPSALRCDQSVATTARESWSDPDLCLADGGAQSCRSYVSGDGNLSYAETRCCATTTVVTARRMFSPISGRNTPRTAGTERRKPMAADKDESPGGILDLEDILPDILKRCQRDTPSGGTQNGRSGGSRKDSLVKGIRCNRPIADGSRGLGDGRVAPAFYSRDERLPHPPSRRTHPIGTCAHQWTTPRSARPKGGVGRGGVAVKPAPETLNQCNHGGKVAGSFRCTSRPRNSGCRSAPKGDGHNPSLGLYGTPAKEFVSERPGVKSDCSWVGPSSRRASAKRSATRGVGVGDAGHSLGSSIRWKVESGGVLEMLAFMEA